VLLTISVATSLVSVLAGVIATVVILLTELGALVSAVLVTVGLRVLIESGSAGTVRVVAGVARVAVVSTVATEATARLEATESFCEGVASLLSV